MIEGLRYTWSERFLLGAITLDLFAVLLAGATALLPVYARDILHVGPEGLGQLRAAPALGAAVVALYLAFKPLRHNVGAKMLWAVVVFGLATIGFGWSHEIGARLFGDARIELFDVTSSMLIALVMLAILGASDMLSVFVRSSLVQLNTPDDKRGRVSAISGLAISASNELGELQSGFAAALLGPVGAVIFGGFGAIIGNRTVDMAISRTQKRQDIRTAIQGENPMKAQSILETIGNSAAHPVEPDVSRMPRSGSSPNGPTPAARSRTASVWR